jgi:sugar lactone lactonase YvrE
MTVHRVRLASKVTHRLAEGPVWDAATSSLFWVDIFDGLVFRGQLGWGDSLGIVERAVFPDLATAISVSASGELLVPGRDRLWFRRASGQIIEGPVLVAPDTGRRLNDGKADPAGRYLIGTVSTGPESHTEELVQIAVDGSTAVLDDDLTLSNGLAWSVDGSRLYSVDTLSGIIYARPYDIASGSTGLRGILVKIADGSPDGICIDAEDHLWVAMWGLGEVRRYSPTGALVERIKVPAPHVTSVAFAGEDLDVLVITTATEALTPAQLDQYPLSGRLFTTRPGVRGIPSTQWALTV